MSSGGCSAWQKTKPYLCPWAEEDPQMPTKVVAIWTDSVGYRGEQTPLRGFGARLLFYNKDENKPVKVDGSLIVYGFDETGRKASNTRPDRKFVFTAKQMAKHYSKSEIGHSYSIWVPWDEAGGPQTSVSLIVRFMPKEKGGNVVISEQTTQLLPGTTKPGSDLAKPEATNDREVRQVAHEEVSSAPAENTPAPASRLKTTTINVPIRSGLRGSPAIATRPTPLGEAALPLSEPAAGGAAERRHASTTPPSASRPVHSAPAKSRALGEPIARPRGDRAQSSLLPGAQRSDLESSLPATSQ
jgi:hypothetical protein